MKKVFLIILAILKSKLIREVAKAAIDMIKKIISEVKNAKNEKSKEGKVITDEEKKQIVKISLSEFKDVINAILDNM